MSYLNKMLAGLGITEADMPSAIDNMMDFSKQVRMIESGDDKMRIPGIEGNTAKGVYQFTDDSVDTGIQRMRNMQDKYGVFNEDFIGSIKPNPQDWNDEQADAMFFANLFSAPDTDSLLTEVALGSQTARQDLYKGTHHTSPDEATIAQMLKYIPNLEQPVDDMFAGNKKVQNAFPTK